MGCFYRYCGLTNKLLAPEQEIVTFVVDSNNRIISLPLEGGIEDDYGNFQLSSTNDVGYLQVLKQKLQITGRFEYGFDNMTKKINGQWFYLWHLHKLPYSALVDASANTEYLLPISSDPLEYDYVKQSDYYSEAVDILAEYLNYDFESRSGAETKLLEAGLDMSTEMLILLSHSRFKKDVLLDKPIQDTRFLELSLGLMQTHRHNTALLFDNENKGYIQDTNSVAKKAIEFKFFVSAIEQMNIEPAYIDVGSQTEVIALYDALAKSTIEVFSNSSFAHKK